MWSVLISMAPLPFSTGTALAMLGEATNSCAFWMLMLRAFESKWMRVRSRLVSVGAPPLDVLSNGRSVRASDADFTVMVARTGGLSAMARRGQLQIGGVEGVATLSQGQVLHTKTGGSGVIEGVSDSLLLDVEWPDEEVTRLDRVDVNGVTDPFAIVTIGEGPEAVKVRADEDGRFSAEVGLAEGVNTVPIRVRDVAGREATRTQTVRRDSTAPVIQSAEAYGADRAGCAPSVHLPRNRCWMLY